MTRKTVLFAALLVVFALVGGPAIATGGGANPDHTTVIAGADRYETAAKVAIATRPDGGSFAQVLYVANGETLVDAIVLGGNTDDDRKLLLVKRDSVPDATRDALQQIDHAKLVFLGGDEAISPAVRDEVMSLTDNTAYPN